MSIISRIFRARSAIRLFVIAAVALMLVSCGGSGGDSDDSTTTTMTSEDTWLIDDFDEYSPDTIFPVSNSNLLPSPSARMWFHRDSSNGGWTRPGIESVNTNPAYIYRGANSAEVLMQGGGTASQGSVSENTFFEIHMKDPNDTSHSLIYWLRQVPGLHGFTRPAWQFDHFNRIRVRYLRNPSAEGGSGDPKINNFYIGAYYRPISEGVTNDEEGSSGWHTYHYFWVEDLGTTLENSNWWTIVMDAHPNHRRGVSGDTEEGDHMYITGESGINYFDVLTRIYLQQQGDMASYPNSSYFDSVEFYHEPATEDNDNLYSFASGYHALNDQVIVSWNTDKDIPKTDNFEVRYAFSDIHTLGFSNATFDATLQRTGVGGYNGMKWTKTRSALTGYTGQSTLYVAVKWEHEPTLFKQIAVEI